MKDLTKDNINKIKYEDIIAIFVAEGGAMGEPNAFHAVLKDLTHYYVNLGDVNSTRQDFFKAFPLMESIRCSCGEVNDLEDGWNWFNVGFGNYLIVRNEYYKSIKEYIEKNMSDNWQIGELFNNWFSVLEKIIGSDNNGKILF